MLYTSEILESINSNTEHLLEYSDITSIRILLTHAFDPKQKLLLKEDRPVFKVANEPLGLTPSRLSFEASKLYIFTNDKVSPERKELLFIQMLENIHASEAEILLAVKDQELGRLYPNITKELVAQYGIIEVDEKPTEESESRSIPEVEEVKAKIEEALSEAIRKPYVAASSGGFKDETSIEDSGFTIAIDPPIEKVDLKELTEQIEVLEEVKPKTKRSRKK